jgi:hypothetical protein
MGSKQIEADAADLYSQLVRDAYFKDKDNIDLAEILRLSLEAAVYFDQQFTLERKKQAKADPGWQAARRKVIARDDGKCKRCGSRQKRQVVHHIIPYEFAPSLNTALWNLVLLCQSCHEPMLGKELEYKEELFQLLKKTAA